MLHRVCMQAFRDAFLVTISACMQGLNTPIRGLLALMMLFVLVDSLLAVIGSDISGSHAQPTMSQYGG